MGDHRLVDDVRSRQGWFGSIQVYHGDLASNVPQWSQDRVNIESNIGIITSDRHPICELGSYYGEATKRMYCPEEYFPVNIHGGVITIQNDIEDKWIQYLDDGGAAQAKQIRADILQEKRNQLLQDKLYKPTGQTITDQIRDIEKEGWTKYSMMDSPAECNKYNSDLTYLEYLQKCGE